MSKRCYYEILGVERSCSDGELKKAFRRLAMKFHPDRAGDDTKEAESRFKEAKEAYEILSDGQKRQAYDQFGHAGVEQGAGGPGGFGGGAGFSDIFGDVFGDIFGGRGGPGRGRGRGADLRYELSMTLEEAVSGHEARIEVPGWVSCSSCDGSGAKAGSSPKTCDTCQGQGQVRMQQGFFSIQQACPACHGQGQVISDPCSDCHGQGRVEERRTLSVKIPAGVDTGDRIRLAGEGEAGSQGGPAGDLYVEAAVQEHPIFVRDGANLYCEVPIRFTSASLGGELEVPTLSGRASIKIPAGTQTGKLFRLRGKGIKPVRGGPVGDLLARVAVETPVSLNARQKELLRELDETLSDGGEKHSPNTSSWLDKVKNFFDKVVPE